MSRRARRFGPGLRRGPRGAGARARDPASVARGAAAFETALRLNPRVYKIHYAYARTCWTVGKPVEGRAHHLELAEQLNPDYHGVPAFLAKVYERLGRADEDATRPGSVAWSARSGVCAHDAGRCPGPLPRRDGAGGSGRGPRQAAEWADRACAIAADDPGGARVCSVRACPRRGDRCRARRLWRRRSPWATGISSGSRVSLTSSLSGASRASVRWWRAAHAPRCPLVPPAPFGPPPRSVPLARRRGQERRSGAALTTSGCRLAEPRHRGRTLGRRDRAAVTPSRAVMRAVSKPDAARSG